MSKLLTDDLFNHKFKTKADYQSEIIAAKGHEEKLTIIYNEIDITNKLLIDCINKINIDILKEKEINQKIKYDLGKTKTDVSGSNELINNYKYLYNLNYAMNFNMIIGIVLAGAFLVKGFSSKV
jgi:hypothetical protein